MMPHLVILQSVNMTTASMNRQYCCVLFDLDGTIADHFVAIHKSCAHAMRAMGVPPADYETVRRTVGGGITTTMGRLVGQDRVDEALRHYHPFFAEHWREGLQALPGALWILRALRDQGMRTAVLTNKEGENARAVCDWLGFTPFLDGVFGGGDCPWHKPDPRFVTWALGELDAERSATCLVGDSPWDIETARGAQIPVHVVPTGTHSLEKLREENPTSVHADLNALGVEVFGLTPPSATPSPAAQ